MTTAVPTSLATEGLAARPTWRERAVVMVLGSAVWAAGLVVDRVLRSSDRDGGRAG